MTRVYRVVESEQGIACRECGREFFFRYIKDQTICVDCLEQLAERIEREELRQGVEYDAAWRQWRMDSDAALRADGKEA